jgi:hypothetical protein
MVVEEAHALGREKRAQAVRLAAALRLGDAEEDLAGPAAQTLLVEGGEHGDRLHQGLARAPGLGDRDEAARSQRQAG